MCIYLDEDGGWHVAGGDLVHGGWIALTREVQVRQGHRPHCHWVQVVGEGVAP